MKDRTVRITSAVEELAAELAHADALIADQQTRIEDLERQVAFLRAQLQAAEAAA